VTARVTFTQHAARGCRRHGIDEDEACWIVENPLRSEEASDPNTGDVRRYTLGQLPDGRYIEVTSEQLSDSVRIWRVIELPESEVKNWVV
jgi:hypothetical protein